MATSRATEHTDTREAILDIAERLVQDRGFNGFSYADISSELGVTKAALHYHFSGKGELGKALISRYSERFAEALAAIESSQMSAFDQLAAYTELYAGVLQDDRMCLCGMLAAEYTTLPRDMRQAVIGFFDANQAWLTRLLRSGKEEGTIRCPGRAEDAAHMVAGALEGAMLLARPYADQARFRAVTDQLLDDFRGVRSAS